MSHILHIAVLRAENGKQACNIVGNEIESWGNENNWRQLIGAVSQKGEVYKNPDYSGGTDELDENSLQEFLDDLLGAPMTHIAFKELANKNEPMSVSDWYNIRVYAEYMAELACLGENEEFDIWRHEFFAWDFGKMGVTQMNFGSYEENELWAVFIDMHV